MRTMALTSPSPVRSAIGEFTKDVPGSIAHFSMCMADGRTRSLYPALSCRRFNNLLGQDFDVNDEDEVDIDFVRSWLLTAFFHRNIRICDSGLHNIHE